MELIVSDSGGKVLVDTVFLNDGTFSATLHTNDTLVDVTTISTVGGFGAQPDYFVFTYKAVNLARWQTVLPGDYGEPIGSLPTYTTATLTYINAPNIANPFADGSAAVQFADFRVTVGPEKESYGQGNPSTFQIQYPQYGNNQDYLLFPVLEQYKFHTHVTDNDTVDLSEMDTAVAVKFTRPAEYATGTSCSLVGYWDTTDYSNSVLLYSEIVGPPINPAADVEYSKEKCQAYELNVSFSNSNNDGVSYYSYGNTVPSTLTLPDESAYNLSSSTSSLFSVNFVGSKPTYYETLWSAGGVYWTYYADPDSTTLTPLATLTAMNSKLLQGQNLSSLALNSFTFGIAQGMSYLPYY